MTQSTVCAVMLTADRPEMARRAVECFRAQTYPAKTLLIYDTGTDDAEDCPGDYPLVIWIPEEKRGRTIGELRNAANSHVEGVEVDLSAGTSRECGANILIHWDSDDWSHPNRIAEQVDLLQASGADVVGYNEMLFWRQDQNGMDALSEAWLYTGSILGTSLCYWRKTWERRPFEARNAGEDYEFLKGLKTVGVSSSLSFDSWRSQNIEKPSRDCEPRMIARIHAGNTSAAYAPEELAKKREWRPVPVWDAHCQAMMEASCAARP